MANQAVRAIQATRESQALMGMPGLGLAHELPGALEDLEALKSFEPGWDLLAARSGSPIQQFIWAEALAEIYREAGRLRVFTVGPRDQPCALAPLFQLGGRLEALGVRELYEPTDLLYADPQAARALAELLLREGRAVSLPRVPADSALIGALQAAYRRRGRVRVVPTHGTPYIELDAGWAEPERRFNAGRRSDFRRALRHAEQLGKVTFEVLVPDPLALPALLDEAWAVEAAGWKGVNRSAVAYREQLGIFYRRFAAAACRKGLLRLCFMRIGGRAAAMQFATECGDRFWLHKIGYDEEFARCAPGNLLMLHTVRYAALRGLRSYELLGCAAPWTAVWAPSMRECVRVRAYPMTARGIAALSADAASSCWRRLKSQP